MEKILQYLKEEGIHASLLEAVEAFRAQFPAAPKEQNRIPAPEYLYYGKEVWEQAVSALLAGKNLLLAGPKASGKNVLSENLGALFGRLLEAGLQSPRRTGMQKRRCR